LAPNAQYTLPKAASGINRTLYYYIGDKITIAGTLIEKYHAIGVNPNVPLTLHNADTEARILVLQGKPIGEPVIQYGPFVMNTKEEINQAFEDYHKTAFGGWPWPKTAQVHPRTEGRFALHADGRKEVKG
jgi:redox-sensitive bicupin YhaK (pirin superfamily)